MNKILRLNTGQVADHAGCHVTTVHKAAEAGELHGGQRKKGGRWSFRIECVEAWLNGQPCDHAQDGAA